MLFQIKRCAAPCTGAIAAADYGRLVEDAFEFLRGRSDDLQNRLAAEMREKAEALAFEDAARLRNRIRALAAVRAVQGVNLKSAAEADVFAIHQDAGQACIQVFFFRAGQNWGNRAYFPKHDPSLAPAIVLEAFIAQFYDGREAPKLILVSEECEDAPLLEEALSSAATHKVEIRRPERGEKREILDAALVNAREALGRRLAESQSVARLLEGVADVFGLPAPPQRIEVYDNSHIQGAHALGAMIVAGPDGFEKAQYRKFNMRQEEFAGDDFAMMRAMIRRRFARMLEEQRDRAAETGEAGVDFSKLSDRDEPAGKFAALPDLVLIDGGEGQLSAAAAALEELGLTGKIAMVAVAKGPDRDAGRERFFMPGKPALRLDEKSPVLYYLQRLRDEAHRFAIGAHRQKRKADIAKNPLDEIGGVGPARKRALLERFGSARGVARAALAELEAVDGVSTELAKRIHDHFHGSA